MEKIKNFVSSKDDDNIFTVYIIFDKIAVWKEWEVIHECWVFLWHFSIGLVHFCVIFVNLFRIFKTDFAFSLFECVLVSILQSPQKSNRSLTSASVDEEEGDTCTICLEPWTNAGDHRLSALRCGHLFGYKCILKWLRGQTRKCPQV